MLLFFQFHYSFDPLAPSFLLCVRGSSASSLHNRQPTTICLLKTQCHLKWFISDSLKWSIEKHGNPKDANEEVQSFGETHRQEERRGGNMYQRLQKRTYSYLCFFVPVQLQNEKHVHRLCSSKKSNTCEKLAKWGTLITWGQRWKVTEYKDSNYHNWVVSFFEEQLFEYL